ncbi:MULTISPECIES: DUF1287 domain-containing protein [Shewanella]|uniref:DUF1287 domain-containing protein n=1 Tax=unclassified Shewanella TaxID=196818 RepID=UPI000C3BED6D|nr:MULTISPECIES: DUF1287 domain-containing protein [Shewanella]NCQ46532.1 DUF1287 domain-containing protein [Shewanella frigidimarina]NCO72764.1 DUF1287 domain-containing protein [Shewanella vesiculosa]NCP38233.1 DUF1287 domain-containing protein [Shewanella vesiculosa]NCP70704.1 DUF1287 domain-containing protein [Shewanella vesiculosa]NCP75966.1 DUF1287 domain-containing protein [Shewanella vesiculosa]
MGVHFSLYPSQRLWGLNSTDRNIHQRRAAHLQTFFKRHGKSLTIRTHDSAYAVSDVVTWILPENLPHIDMVIAQVDATTGNPMIVHYIGFAPKIDF